jgi:hypothetical protein
MNPVTEPCTGSRRRDLPDQTLDRTGPLPHDVTSPDHSRVLHRHRAGDVIREHRLAAQALRGRLV